MLRSKDEALCITQPIPVAERFKARVCGRSLAGIAGSNPAGSMNAPSFVIDVCCQRFLQRADPSSRGVLLTLVCHCV